MGLQCQQTPVHRRNGGAAVPPRDHLLRGRGDLPRPRLVFQRPLHPSGQQGASYVDYTRALFTNWAADSAAQDYTIVNLVLLPLWTIVDGRRRGLRIPWIFFVMSLFTSLAFSMAFYLAFVERQIRFDRAVADAGGVLTRAA